MSELNIEIIKKILYEVEEVLSDGYYFYCGDSFEEESSEDTITRIAKRILKEIKNDEGE